MVEGTKCKHSTRLEHSQLTLVRNGVGLEFGNTETMNHVDSEEDGATEMKITFDCSSAAMGWKRRICRAK